MKEDPPPLDEHALEVRATPGLYSLPRLTAKTLTVFVGSVLEKKYTNPSTDVISIIAGLDAVDRVFTDFVETLDSIIRKGRNCES